jgi:hypothetical protein
MVQAFPKVDLRGHSCHVQDTTQDTGSVRNATGLE